MGEMVGDEDHADYTENDEAFVKLSVRVRCPICREPIKVSQGNPVLAGGNKASYFTLSNFHKHIKIHIENVKEKNKNNKKLAMKGKISEKLKNKKPSKKTSKQEHNKSKDKKSKPLKQQEAMTTSSDSEGNAQISKELAQNFVDESDDLVSDLDDSSPVSSEDQTSSQQPIPPMPKLRRFGKQI